MDTSTSPKDWRTVLTEQRRPRRWLADHTGKSRRTVYAYSQNKLTPPAKWLADVGALLGEPVIHEATA